MSSEEPRVANFFAGVAWTHLAPVDLPGFRSNQHEIGGLEELRRIIGETDRKRKEGNGIKTLWRFFDEDGEDIGAKAWDVSYYDTRRNDPKRTAEWRMYYPSQRGVSALDDAMPGDLLLVVAPTDELLAKLEGDVELAIYVVSNQSQFYHEVLHAVGVVSAEGWSESSDLQSKLSLQRREVLERLEPSIQRIETTAATQQDGLRKRFRTFLAHPATAKFPSTEALASYAQSLLTADPTANPDEALIELLEHETRAFYYLEQAQLAERLARQMAFADTDEFISFSLSVQNRRKSRRGRSLERHLEFIFQANGLTFESQVWIGGRSVDFLFPGIESYRLLEQGRPRNVVMLASKSSCKERWTQVLQEAPALSQRYLFTLDTAIPYVQTALMGRDSVSLVVPNNIIDSFVQPHWAQPTQCGTDVFVLKQFIALAKSTT